MGDISGEIATIIDMSDGMRADPIQLTRLADQMLRSSTAVADAWRLAQGALAIPVDAFGDTAGGPGISAGHQATVDDAEVAIGRLVAVLEGDMDRLYRVAFAYEKADEDAAHEFRQQQRDIQSPDPQS